MACLLRLLFFLLIWSLRSRRHLLLENLALRQQLAVLACCCLRPRFSAPVKLFWVVLRRLWTGWRKALILVQPDSVWVQAVLEMALTRSKTSGKEMRKQWSA
jgi:hypothetical protein